MRGASFEREDMADNVGNSDGRPDLDLENEFGEDEGTLSEQ